jgi:hypothetical protein
MKTAFITAAGQTPVYAHFIEPVASGGKGLVIVSASALKPIQQVPVCGFPLQFRRRVSLCGWRRWRRTRRL